LPLYSLIRPLLFAVDPEVTHRATVRLSRWLSGSAAARRAVRSIYDRQFPELAVQTLGLSFPNPVGLAAGFDKHAELHQIMPELGFGFVEIGSVSLLPWRGNPSPNLLRLPEDHALLNRLGLNSAGSDVVYGRLASKPRVPLGINIIKTADPQITGSAATEDYLRNFEKCYPLADYITLNLSCPNTPDGRTFEDPETLAPFLERLRETEKHLIQRGNAKPILAKLSPDLDSGMLARVLEITEQYSISGYVVTNTTTRRDWLKTPRATLEQFGYGGLSGLPLVRYSQPVVRAVWERTAGKKPIIAVGGVGCDPRKDPAELVWEYMQLGATLVQLYTGLIYSGPSLVRMINTGLARLLRNNEASTLAEFLARRDQRGSA
jgi:dihydroorotate dehydrogenase